jgi:molybdenum cofactor cytidylyltransferase
MQARTSVTGLVLAAGGSSRLGQPKQLLAFGDATLLDHVLDVARRCPFDQVLCVVNRRLPGIDFHSAQGVVNPDFGRGCSSSIAAALGAVHGDVLVLMLGDQPGVTADTVAALLAGRGDAPLAACRYEDGRGHPLAFARSMFGELGSLHGDKGVWKLLDRFADEVVDVPVPGTVPRDVDTWEDYEAVRGS